MKPEKFGYNESFEKFRIKNNLEDFDVGRVIAEHKERYVVKTAKGDYDAEITGNLRFSAQSREDFPAVGDWVALTIFEESLAIIHAILPRYSLIKRQSAGQSVEIQIIAANIDYAFLVQDADRDFNMNRLERYLTICHTSKVSPIIVLTKIDLIDELKISRIIEQLQNRIKNVPVIALSNETQTGYSTLTNTIRNGKTYCMLGSSGVGKSTLINNLSGKALMTTGKISDSTSKGRHITSHRQLVILENGGILIDNPGMREVGITNDSYGLETTFEMITNLAKNCKFNDCTHTSEIGCAVIEAVDNRVIDRGVYNNFLKIEREKDHFESTTAERRKKDKAFGKMVKKLKKDINKTRDY